MTNDNTEFQLSHMEETTRLLKMKSKKRHHNSSDESEDSEGSVQSSSSSDSDSDDSSISEPRHKKKRKRANSSDSDSNSDDQKRVKKRKHKKKKKKHSKKKRRSDSLEDVTDDNISISDGEISVKKKRKHKHKHSKRSRSSVSGEEQLERHGERRLMSVVKERRASSEEGSQPSRTYYQKEYHSAAATKDYQSEHESQKYYKVSGREQHVYQDYNYTRERNERYATHDDNRQREKFGHSSHNEEYSGRPREYNEFKRPSKYGESRPEELYKKDREVPYVHKEDPRGNPRYPQRYEERPPKRREFDDSRDYRERRCPPEPDRYREKQYDKRERYNEERYSPERGREIRRERPARPVKPPTPLPHQREESRSRSSEERYREKKRERDEREPERYRQDERRDRRTDERPDGRRTGRPDKPEPRNRERKTRFDNANDEKEYSWGKTEVKKEGDKNPGDKEKPNFGLSGKLTADANTVNGVVIKYTEPDDAKQPKRRWRFYPFKGDKALPILYIHRQSCFLIGRDKKVVDIALEHPSISKQHAALQYRATPFTRQDGSQGRRVRPYVIDLESANGTFVNNKKVEARRYVELLERDVVKFGFSAREYVLLHENSKDEAQDDDQEPAPTTGEGLRRDKHEREAAAADGE